MKKTLIAAVLLPIILAAAATVCSLWDRTIVHISTVHPELSYLSSIYVDARGFPFPMWATNDPAISGFGETKSVILYDGILWNMGLWGLLFYLITLPVVAAIAITRFIKQRKTANNAPGTYFRKSNTTP
jgi:hypothetical protein